MLNFNLIKENQSFTSKNDMDKAVRAFLYHYKPELAPGTLTTLKYLWRHSVKFPGVSFCKIETIIKSTKLSRSTVIRSINTLQEYGLLKRIPTLKPNGKRGVNILVLQAVEGCSLPSDDTLSKTANETPTDQQSACESKDEQPKTNTETENKQSINFKDLSNNVKKMDSTFIPSYVDKSFTELAKNFFEIKEVFSLWSRVNIAYKKANLKFPIQSYIQEINQLLKQTVFAYKNNLIKTTIHQYFYGGLVKLFDQIKKKEVMADSNNLYYDWLNESV